MHDLGLSYNKGHKKSARVVGEVLGKYHPHGDGSVYDAMVRMAQDWSLRYTLVDGQGNFGHIDGDSPAAMRYTEARLTRLADELLQDIDKQTVNFGLNFDDSLEEPTVLPARFPNLLVNGASGIAVGMATNMLPHNLTEAIDAVIATVDNPDITIDELCEIVKAPDLPTGGIIYGIEGVREAYRTGRGRVVVRGKAEIEADAAGRESIIITEIPFQVNKSNLLIKINELYKEGKVTGISAVRDESNREGIRIVIELQRDAMGGVVLSQLYKFSPLQTSYGVNNLALVNGRPRTLSLKEIIEEFIKFRLEVIVRRTQFDLRKAEERAHILEGLLIALDHLDEVIELIRNSKTVDEAREGLMTRFGLSETQAKAILDLRLQKLVGLERDKIRAEYDEVLKTIAYLKSVLESELLQRGIIKDELTDIRERYGDARRTDISFAEGEISIEDLIPNEEMVVTISHRGYIKRTNIEEYRIQGRGGRGSRGARTRQEDFVEHMFVASAHNYLLLFTEKGRCHWLRVYEVPEAAKAASGRVIQNIIQLPSDDKVRAYIIVEDLNDQTFLDAHYIVFATRLGIIKKTPMEAFSRPRANGINAISVREDDQLIEVKLTNGHNEIILANRNGRAIRFPEERVRPMGRTASGVIGMSLDDDGDDAVIGMVCVDPDEDVSILVLSEKGNGKKSALEDYRTTNRGGKGVKTMQITDKTGPVVGIKSVLPGDQLIITSKNGITIRMALDDVRVMGRATQGVKMIALGPEDAIADLAIVRDAVDGDEEE